MAFLSAGRSGSSWDYVQLTGLAEARAARLLELGLLPGQLVAVPESPNADLVLMQHALARAGAALLPLAGGLGSEERRTLFDGTSTEWLWDLGSKGAGRLIPTGRSPTSTASGEVWPSPLALTVQTGGTSGGIRAVMLTADALLASAQRVNRRLGLVSGDRWLCCLPLRHIGGLSIAYRCALAGACLVLREGFEAATVMDDLVRHGITHCSLVPPMLARLLDLGVAPPGHLRAVLVGGQSLGVPLARRALESGWPLYLSYGMTETASAIAVTERLADVPRPGYAGTPLPGIELDCGDPPGSVPLRLRGPVIMAGYANAGRVPGDGIDSGWLVAGDLVRLDPQGGLYCLGRADEVLVTGGVNVHPVRVESVLQAAPGVGDLAVVGLEDPIWGLRLAAVYTGPAVASELDAWSRSRLRPPERPRILIRIPGLPLLPSGKLDRRRIAELASDAWQARDAAAT